MSQDFSLTMIVSECIEIRRDEFLIIIYLFFIVVFNVSLQMDCLNYMIVV